MTDNELAFLRDDPEMADLFLAEALDHLGTIEAALLALDDRPANVETVWSTGDRRTAEQVDAQP